MDTTHEATGGAEDIDANQVPNGDYDELKQSKPIKDEDNQAKDEAKEEDKEERPSFTLYSYDTGIWRVFYQKKKWDFLPGPDGIKRLKEALETLPYMWKFIKEIWPVVHAQLFLWALLSLWEPLDATASLWVSATVYNTVSILGICIKDSALN
jgi:hypothetical protein